MPLTERKEYLLKRREYLCLKGTNNIARGNAPGVKSGNRPSPERAKQVALGYIHATDSRPACFWDTLL